MPKITPLYDKILLERLKAESTTSGGILLPDSAKEKPTEGRVVATGAGRLNDDGDNVPMAVKVGDRVLFGSYSGTDIKLEGKEYLIIDAGELLAVVDDRPWARIAGGKSAGKKPAAKKPTKAKAKSKSKGKKK